MIQNRTQDDRQVSGNLVGEDIKMQVGDMTHILNTMTDLYSDRERACIREYSTNAWDAHVEAGVTSPIEVTTPTHLSPFLTIRDFGVGLSLEDIREVYSQYGISTKRSTNAQNGMLGLGCKSALSYADQFTVTSVKEGVRIQVVVARNTQGASMKVVDTSSTSEPNGTTVTIPARSGNQIERKAREFFSYWAPGRVTLNSAAAEQLPEAQWVIKDKLALVTTTSYGAVSEVVMGGVAYPAPNLTTNMGRYSKLIAFVDIGAVDFAPSREALMDTDTTNATLRQIEKDLEAAMQRAVLDDIAAATTPREAIERKLAWAGKVPSTYIPASTPYKGRLVPNNFSVPDGTIFAPMYGSKMASNSEMTDYMPMKNVLTGMWVVGWDHASFTATTKKKLVKYCEDNQLAVSGFMLSKGAPDTYWVEGIPVVKWEDIKAIKLPRNVPNPLTGRLPGSYDVWEDGDLNEDVPADDIDTSNPIFWMFGKYYDGRRYIEWLHDHFPGYTLVMLRRGREDKFKRLFPASREVSDVIREGFQRWAGTVGKDVKLALAVKGDYHLADYDYLDASKIKDPRFATIAKYRKRDLSAIQAEINAWAKLGQHFDEGDHSLQSPLDAYPLLPTGYTLQRMALKKAKMEHVYRYMNCEYAHQQKVQR